MDSKTVNHWLARGMMEAPSRTALCFGEECLTFAELDAFSNRIAHHLANHGVHPGDNVGICLNRSIEMVGTVIGILKAGAAYVPLDPAYPDERLGMMAVDARIRCSVVHAAHVDKIRNTGSDVLLWDSIAPNIDTEPATPLEVAVAPEDVAYVIFTSGSTGRPKGIEMPHRALANLVEWQLARETFKPGARVLQYSSISFDVSFQEIATTLASGGTLHLVADQDRRDPRRLLDQLIAQGIERLFLPYVAMRSLIEAAHATGTYPAGLKEVITAGEQLRIDAAVRDFFARIEGATLDNQYGPSETHVITAHLLGGDPAEWPDLPSIGTPLDHCATLILDAEMQSVAPGEEGELYLAGRNLARGYIGREDLTREAFVASPPHLSTHPVLYKTGDLAAFNPDGTIEFRGRRDHQIKIRGHRIEPGEINNAASSFPGVGQCLTHAFRGNDGILQLATYFCAPQDGLDVAALRSHLASKLPEYMVPAFLVELDEIPYTPSGKVDLKALPKPTIENSRFAGAAVHYETETERALSKVWNELLGLEGLPRNADFFELGGDSLRAVTLFLKIQQQFGRDLPLSTLLHASTIETLARHIDEGGEDAFPGCRSLKLLQRGQADVAPLFLVHGGAGNILCFSTFAKNLGSAQPVYAFQWSGWDGGRGEATIEAMAQVYCEELLKHFPDTPVRIGGYCIGGYIAIELAWRLRQMGVDVQGPLLVFDSPNLRSKTYHRRNPAALDMEFERTCSELAEKRICDDAIPSQEPPPEPLPWLKRTPPYALARVLRTWLRLRKCDRDATQGRTIPVSGRNWYCAMTQKAAVRKHKSRGTDMPVLYFRSEGHGSEMLLTGWWSGLYMGFDEVCRGGFEGHIIGGGHGEILDHPKVAERVLAATGSGKG